MAKFAIECPKCGTVNTASTFFLAKKVIRCGHCGNEINTRTSRLTTKVCPSCGKTVVYDQSKPEQNCPACGKSLRAAAGGAAPCRVLCPQCGVSVEVDRNAAACHCPVCDGAIDVRRELARAGLVNDTEISVLRYEGDNETLVWKHPIEDFNFGSQLIVHESQEAVFFADGAALDTFGPGRYTLESDSLPLLKKAFALPDRCTSPFHAEVYFINKTVAMGVRWGTDARVRFIDPLTGIPLDIGAHGEMALAVKDGRRLLLSLVGTGSKLTHADLLGNGNGISGRAAGGCFRAILSTQVKSRLAQTIVAEKLNILEIDAHLDALSATLGAAVAPAFEEFGLAVSHFTVAGISLPEDDENFKKNRQMLADRYLKVREQELAADVQAARRKAMMEEKTTEVEMAKMEAEMQRIRAGAEADAARARGMAEADVMAAKGYSGRDELQAEVQKAYAEGMGNMGGGSGGSGGVAADLIGLMAGMKMAGNVMDQFGKASETPAPAPAGTWTCSCGQTGNTGRFCGACGRMRTPAAPTWTCSCGQAGNRGRFCEACGREHVTTWDCPCGQTGNTGRFCGACGRERT